MEIAGWNFFSTLRQFMESKPIHLFVFCNKPTSHLIHEFHLGIEMPLSQNVSHRCKGITIESNQVWWKRLNLNLWLHSGPVLVCVHVHYHIEINLQHLVTQSQYTQYNGLCKLTDDISYRPVFEFYKLCCHISSTYDPSGITCFIF